MRYSGTGWNKLAWEHRPTLCDVGFRVVGQRLKAGLSHPTSLSDLHASQNQNGGPGQLQPLAGPHTHESDNAIIATASWSAAERKSAARTLATVPEGPQKLRARSSALPHPWQIRATNPARINLSEIGPSRRSTFSCSASSSPAHSIIDTLASSLIVVSLCSSPERSYFVPLITSLSSILGTLPAVTAASSSSRSALCFVPNSRNCITDLSAPSLLFRRKKSSMNFK